MCNYQQTNLFYLFQSSDDDFEEIEFGSGSEPEVITISYSIVSGRLPFVRHLRSTGRPERYI